MIALYIIIGIILLFVISSFLLPTAFNYEAEVKINKNKEQVFNYIKSLNNQDYWLVWNLRDPDMKKEYSGTDGTVGFMYSWEGKKAGKGEQEIKNIIEGERIETQLRFEKPFKAMNDGYFITHTVEGNKTKVMWGMKGSVKRPMNVVSAIMKSVIMKDFHQGLTNLKNVLEK